MNHVVIYNSLFSFIILKKNFFEIIERLNLLESDFINKKYVYSRVLILKIKAWDYLLSYNTNYTLCSDEFSIIIIKTLTQINYQCLVVKNHQTQTGSKSIIFRQ